MAAESCSLCRMLSLENPRWTKRSQNCRVPALRELSATRRILSYETPSQKIRSPRAFGCGLRVPDDVARICYAGN